MVERVASTVENLREHGLRLTPQRVSIVEAIVSMPGHFDAEELCARLGSRGISRATVYRTMELLVALNLVRPLYLNDPTQRFVSATGGHHHLVCTNCGAIIEFDYCTADQMAQKLAEQYNFLIHNHLLEFQGMCQACK